MKHGFPESSYTVASDSFVVRFDYKTRNPHWVVERLTQDSVRHEVARKRENFHEAKEIPKVMRNHLADFAGSGYDRGHLAAAANHSGRGFRDTFSLANVSPQVGKGLNRDYWARFEKFVRDIVLSGNADEVSVATGPLFLRPTKKLNGRIQIPSHFYKVVLAETTPRSLWSGAGYSVAAFVVPNQPVDPDTPITDFLVPLHHLEATAGVIHFSKLLTESRRRALRHHEQKWLVSSKTQSQLLLSADKNPDSTKKESDESVQLPSTDILHLCDRVKCELVSEKWLNYVRSSSSSSSN